MKRTSIQRYDRVVLEHTPITIIKHQHRNIVIGVFSFKTRMDCHIERLPQHLVHDVFQDLLLNHQSRAITRKPLSKIGLQRIIGVRCT